jgi:hypothetical protein
MDLNEKKKAAAAIAKMGKQLTLTIAVLDADVKFAAEQWRKSPSNQFWRRTLVRCLCALAEGVLSLLKNIAPDSAKFFEVELTEKDMEVATERRNYIDNGIQKSKPAFLKFSENLKETFKLFAKAHTVQFEIRYDKSGFKELCDTFDSRNKLMHPKGLFDVEVSDKAVDAADQGMKWFDSELHNLLQECGGELPYSKTNS